MIKYNICFVRRGDEVLLLNRKSPPWMGCWNGVGGKLEANETPRDSMLRELEEETHLQDYSLTFKGVVTWSVNGSITGGMYLYLAEVPEDYIYHTPITTAEGILDWKPVKWITDDANVGIAANIPGSLKLILHDPNCYDHRCTYKDGKLVEQTPIQISALIETDEAMREALLKPYRDEGVTI